MSLKSQNTVVHSGEDDNPDGNKRTDNASESFDKNRTQNADKDNQNIEPTKKRSGHRMKSSCNKCEDPDNMDMVACDACSKWFHYTCVGVNDSISEKSWNCERCADKGDEKSKSHSKSSVSSKTARLALAKLEAERQLNERIAKEMLILQEKYLEEKRKTEEAFLTSKFQILDTASRSSVASSICDISHNRTKAWVGEQLHLTKSNQRGVSFDDDAMKLEISKQAPPAETKMPICDYVPPLFNSMNLDQTNFLGTGFCATSNAPLPTAPPPAQPSNTFHINQLPMMSGKFSSSLPKIGRLRTLTEDQFASRLEKEALPSFSGLPGEWPVFIAAYNRTTANCNYTDDENLGRLIKALTGNARKLVQARLRSPAAVKSVIETLYRNYGRPDIILDEIVATIEKHPQITMQRMDLLLQFSAMVEDLCATLQETCTSGHLNDSRLLQLLIGKLPFNLQMGWTLFVGEKSAIDLNTFNGWLITMANAASRLPKPKIWDKKTETKATKPPFKNVQTIAVHNTESSTSESSDKQKSCVACKEESHLLEKCSKFLEMPRYKRWTILSKFRLCRTCLKKHNGRCQVSNRCGVDGCTRFHHALLHNSDDNNTRSAENNAGTSVTNSKKPETEKVVISHHQSTHSILYRILPVHLYGPERSVKTYAFIDEGSSTSLIEREIADELQIDGPSGDLCLRWTGDVSRLEEDSKVVSMEISGIHADSKKYRLSGVNTVKKLELPTQTVNEKTLSKFEHLKRLPISCFDNVKPTMIIGLDNYRLVMPLVTKSGEWEDPIASKTHLGWTVYGAHRNGSHEGRLNFHLCDCGNEMDRDLTTMVKAFWSLDNFGVGTEKILESKNDIRAMTIMKNKTKPVNGRFETGLLWRHDDVKLPSSREMALRRLLCFENKLHRDPELMSIVNDKIRDHLNKGYARKLLGDEIEIGPKTWYLPIFSVQNPNKPTKVRLVWDAAAKSYGVSLNDFLLKGPDNLTPLVNVLFKFREQQYAVSGDICEMFHRVLVNEADTDAQRFLWRFCDRTKEPDEFSMNVLTFGATCSPSLAQFVKNTNADRFVQEHPRAADAIKTRHYVDDWLDSFATYQEAIDVINQVIKIHAAAGFHIRNWRSNDVNILQSIGQDMSNESKSMSGSDAVTDKVLGMWWQTDRDMFVFRVNHARVDADLLDGTRVPTKRQVLSIIMSTFDPLGLLSPFIVHGKVIVQSIWQTGVDWDEPIGVNVLEKWVIWASQLKSIEETEIPRRYFIQTKNDNNSVFDLHIFCDAGGDAYAACAYVRNCHLGKVEVSLIASKTRVNPKKVVSVPRLELLAAVLGVRLLKMVTDSHSIKFNSQTIWSDSTTVLAWMKSDTRRYKQFVALRISECLESTNEDQWRYVPTKQNIADMGTKWPIDMQRLATEWITGPEFLYDDPSTWPKHPNTLYVEPEEELSRHLMISTSKTVSIITPNLENLSTWGRMTRAQAYFNRAIRNFKTKRDQYERGPLTRRTKWYAAVPSIEIDNIVVVVDEKNARGTWPKGRIVDVIRGGDGVVRSAVVRTSNGLYTRPVAKLAKIDVETNCQTTGGSFDKGGEC